jgi:magnesium chelatase family protein
VQVQRYAHLESVYCNAMLPGNRIQDWCAVTEGGMILLKTAMQRLNLSARAYDRILKVSRTIADLAGSSRIEPEHLAEAIQYRSLDRENWGA